MNSKIKVKYCTESVPKGVILNLFQNLHTLFKLGDTGSGSGMTKLSLFVSLLLCGSPTFAQNTSIKWHPFEDAIQIAGQNQQPILVDVWAPWCGWCKKMQKEVYPNVSGNLSNQFVWTRLNRDDHDSNLLFKKQPFTPFRLAQKLNVQSVPSLIVLSPTGEYLLHTSGFTELEILESVLEYVASKAYLNESFQSFATANQ